MNERTFIMLKPETLKDKAEFEILDRFRKKGFSIAHMYQAYAPEEKLREHYAEVFVKYSPEQGEWVIQHMMSGPVIAAILEGTNVIQAVREMAGKTDPIECSPGTIRFDYSEDSFESANSEERALRNIIHAADSKESAEKEIRLYPNPASDRITINGLQNGAEIRIFNLQGQIVSTHFAEGEQTEISTKDIPRGLYIVQVNQNGKLTTNRVVFE